MKYLKRNIRIVKGEFQSGKRKGQPYTSMSFNLHVEEDDDDNPDMEPIYVTVSEAKIKPYLDYAVADPTNPNLFTVNEDAIRTAMALPDDDPKKLKKDLLHMSRVYNQTFILDEPYARMYRTGPDAGKPITTKNGNYIIIKALTVYEKMRIDNETGEKTWVKAPEEKRDEILQLYYRPLRELLPTVQATGGATLAEGAPTPQPAGATLTPEQLANAVNNL